MPNDVPITSTAPGVFTADATGAGQGAIQTLHNVLRIQIEAVQTRSASSAADRSMKFVQTGVL